MITIPSQYTPSQTVTLSDGLTLSPSKRVSVEHIIRGNKGSSINDSFHLSPTHDVTSIDFKDWLLFHSFIFGEGEIFTALKHFHHDYEFEDIRPIDEKNRSSIDYEDILDDVYSVDSSGAIEEKSYSDLYDKYLKMSDKEKILIKNLIILVLDDEVIGQTPQRKIIDDSYWRIVAGYSVIETLIGDQPATCHAGIESGICPVCCKPVSHKPLPDNKWIESQLTSFVGNKNRAKEYSDLVVQIKKNLRNPTAHGKSHPKASSSPFKPGHFTYSLEESINLLEQDSSAVESLKVQIFSLGKILILNRFFNLNIFPTVSVLSSFGIGSDPRQSD